MPWACTTPPRGCGDPREPGRLSNFRGCQERTEASTKEVGKRERKQASKKRMEQNESEEGQQGLIRE